MAKLCQCKMCIIARKMQRLIDKYRMTPRENKFLDSLFCKIANLEEELDELKGAKR